MGFFNLLFICEHGFSYKLEGDFRNKYSLIEEKDIKPGKTNDYNFNVKPFNILKVEIKNKTQKYDQILVFGQFLE